MTNKQTNLSAFNSVCQKAMGFGPWMNGKGLLAQDSALRALARAASLSDDIFSIARAAFMPAGAFIHMMPDFIKGVPQVFPAYRLGQWNGGPFAPTVILRSRD